MVPPVDGEKNEMKNKKKIIGNGIFLFLVLGLTLYGVFHGEDLGLIWKNVKKADLRFLFPAVCCVVFFIWGESIIIHYLLCTLNIRLKKWKCFLISSVGFFFSCITPSASGGQPMQMVYLKKEKIPVSVSSVVLMIVTITYKLVLVLLGMFVLLFQPRITDIYMQGGNAGDVAGIVAECVLCGIYAAADLSSTADAADSDKKSQAADKNPYSEREEIQDGETGTCHG